MNECSREGDALRLTAAESANWALSELPEAESLGEGTIQRRAHSLELGRQSDILSSRQLPVTVRRM